MSLKDKLIAGFAVLLLALVLFLWLSPTGIKHVPDIELTLMDGHTLRLSALRGRPVLITFWATTCPGCIREMPHLIKLYHELANKGLEIIGIAMHYDPPNQVLGMIKGRNIPYKIALDLDKKALRAFGIRELTPNSFLVAPDGKIVYHKVGEMDMDKLRKQIIAMLPGG